MISAPDGYAETPEGLLFLADGLSAPARWDGIAPFLLPVGTAAPTTAPSVAKATVADPAPAAPGTAATIAGDPTVVPAGPLATTTPIIGTYNAYVRWAGANGIFSHLSPISNTLILGDPAAAVAALAKAMKAAAASANSAATLYQAASVADGNYTALVTQLATLLGGGLAPQIAVGTADAAAMSAAATAFTNLGTAATNAAAAVPSTAAALDALFATAYATATAAAAAAVTSSNNFSAGSGFSVITSGAATAVAAAAGAAGAAAQAADAAAVAAGGSALVSAAAAAAAVTAANSAIAGGSYGLVYTNVPVPPAGIVRRQILRNVNGDLNDFYVDIDTSDTTSTTLRSSNYDTAIDGGTPVTVAGANVTSGIVGTYYAYVRFLNDLFSPSNLSPISNTLILAEADLAYGVTYTNVPVPTQANVVRRQILRNSAGQAGVFYVDVDTTDLTSTTFTSAKFDQTLISGTAVPIFDTAGNALANSHAQPPTHKTVMAHHLGRMFLAVDSQVRRGGVAVVGGSATVAGLNTAWTAALAGRFLWVRGASTYYQIASVNVAAQTLTLSSPYADASNPFADYGIRPASAERRLIYYSEGGQVESWPLTSALSVQEDGDELTGLMVKGSFLYIIESRHIYRYTFQTNPATDGFVFLSTNRGAVNNRCWVIAEDTTYMMDYSGIHAFDGQDSKAISDPIQHFWRSEANGPQINWSAQDLFFCVHSQDEQYIRWFVALAGETYPRHAIALDYKQGRWWVEEFDRPLSAGCSGTFDHRRRVYLGGEANSTYLGWQGPLEGIPPTSGLTRASVTSATTQGLTDSANYGSWPTALVGQTVTIVSGRGLGQRRTIRAVAGNTLKLATDWSVKPDATSVYQLGGISWLWQSGWLRYTKDETDNGRRVETVFDPTAESASLVMRVYRDFSKSPVVFRTTRKGKENEGYSTQNGRPEMTAEMDVPRGYAQARMDGHKEMNMEGTRYVSVELSGVSGASEQTLFQVIIDGVQT